MIMISLKLEKTCETLIAVRKFSVVIEAKIQTKKSNKMIAVSQANRNPLVRPFIEETMGYALSLIRWASSDFSDLRAMTLST